MSMRTTSYKLDMVPGGVPTVVRLSQGDEDYTLVFELYASSGEFTIESGTTVRIHGTKPDGNGYSVDAVLDIENAKVTVEGDIQMTAAAGKGNYELVLYKGGKKLKTANFIIWTEHAALDQTSVASDSKVAELYEIENNAEEIIAAGAQYAEYKAALDEVAQQVAEDAESVSEDKQSVTDKVNSFNETYSDDMAAFNQAYSSAMQRINDKADAIGEIVTDAGMISRQALEKATNAENETAEFAYTVDSVTRNFNTILLTLEGKVDDGYVEDGYLYLTSNGEIVVGPLGPFSGGGGGGGGGGGNNASLSVTNTSGWLSTTIADGDDCPASILWSSIEDEMPTGDGTAKITVNGAVRSVLNVTQGNVFINLAPYCTVGSNVIKVTISDVYDNSRTINFTVNVIAISISSTFDAATPYMGAISFPYTPVGTINKTIHFLLDGVEIGTTTTSVSGRQMSFTIPQQSHGAHSFECYFDCEINGQVVTSNRLYFEIICLETMNTDPIIVSSFRPSTVSQYTTLHIDYTVYDPIRVTAPVEIRVNGALAAQLTVDRTQQIFTYRADDVGTLTVSIVSGSMSKTFEMQVTESDIHVEPETDQLKLYLASAGRSNNEENPGTWESGNIACTFSNFNFRSDGWLNDEDGITVLRVAGDARVTIPYMAFGTDFRATGKTIEIEFATRDVMNYDSTIMSCMSGGRGFSLTAQLARLASEQSEISMQFKENEHVRISFVVEKRSQNRLIYIYVNGIMSGVVQYPASDDFSQASPVGISIGSNDCTIDIYCIRVYDNNLERGQILTNWIADTRDVTQMLERYRRNSVYDEYGNIVIAKLPSTLPYMIIECPELPQYKGDKKTVDITYVDPVASSRSFTAQGAQADVQGTSSQYYPRKNYKIKFKGGFDLSNGTHISKYPLRVGAIPTNTFTFKADVASSEGANNVELVRLYENACPYRTPGQTADSAVRQGIDGFPIVIFWNDGESTRFMGKYNFNNDKGTPEVFGFAEDDESWEIRNNTSDRVIWKSDDYTGSDWLNDFEARYPDEDPAYEDPTQLAAFASWLKSTDTEAATGNALPASVTYDGVTYTNDTAAYRLAKFKAEAGNYMEMQSTLFYYLFTELFLMVDSRAKNAFPSFMGSEVIGT